MVRMVGYHPVRTTHIPGLDRFSLSDVTVRFQIASHHRSISGDDDDDDVRTVWASVVSACGCTRMHSLNSGAARNIWQRSATVFLSPRVLALRPVRVRFDCVYRARVYLF